MEVLIMFGKNINKKVELYVMATTVCLFMTSLWTVLATSETALAATPAEKGGGVREDSPRARANAPTYHLVLNDNLIGMHVGTRDLSPSGDRIVFEHEKKLYITDQAASATRLLLAQVSDLVA
jgi:hypothetical protein